MIPKSDHCTGWFEGWWSHCCEIHDSQYANSINRYVSDVDLLKCVTNSYPEVLMNSPELAVVISGAIAVIMFAGVRLFGWYFYKK